MFGLLRRRVPQTGPLPVPPLELRKLVGNVDERAYDNAAGGRVYESVAGSSDDFVLDFGCGCGRIARQLLQQAVPPRKYVGIDLHKGMIRWCREKLAARNPNFDFQHQDVRNPGFNPRGRRTQVEFPTNDGIVSLLIAHSVFTHLVESQAEFYLREIGRVLRDGGIAVTTFFLFDKSGFPMMQEFQNALYINLNDPTNAVMFDREWLKSAACQAGLRIRSVEAPTIRGFHWHIHMERVREGLIEHVGFPADDAPVGRAPPPLLERGAHRYGA